MGGESNVRRIVVGRERKGRGTRGRDEFFFSYRKVFAETSEKKAE